MLQNNDIKIKAVGLGGGGNNTINKMVEDGISNVSFLNINTEEQMLNKSKTKKRMQIGKKITRGLGAGANPEIGRRSALENEDEIRRELIGNDLVFLTAGMGGGTGTGAIPVIAKISKELGILTIAVVTKPFAFEGRQRMKKAIEGIEELKDHVDAMIVILNDNLVKYSDNTMTVLNGFSIVDEINEQVIKGIIDIVTIPGDINIDFADVKTILKNKGRAYVGIATATGDNKIYNATKAAISNPLTENKIIGAKSVIINIKGSETLSLLEINDGIELINKFIDEDANIIFGTIIDKTMGDEVEVTVLGTGVSEE